MATATVTRTYTTDAEWQKAFRAAFKRRIRGGKEFTSEDIRNSVGMPPDAHPSMFSSRWRNMLKEFVTEIEIVGLRRSSIASAKGRMIPVYRATK